MNNEKKIFTAPAILTSIRFTKDGGLGINFATNELTSEEKMAISAFYGGFGWLCFSENPIGVSDLPKEQAEDMQKTPSKRLRAVLYVLHQQRGVKEDFENWYRVQMEKVIDRIKSELD